MDGETRRLVDFERVEAIRGSKGLVNPDDPLPYDLVVRGTKPRPDMEVTLEVERDSEDFLRTGYLGYHVVGVAPGAARHEPVPYEASTSLGALEGKGVLAIGATVSQAIEVPPGGAVPGTCHDWVALRKREPGEVPLLYVAGRCEFPTTGYAVELQPHASQSSDPDELLLDLVVRAPNVPVPDGRATALDAVWRESTQAEHAAVVVLPEGHRVPVEDVDGVGFLGALMRRSLGR
jgi:hypothetical protein